MLTIWKKLVILEKKGIQDVDFEFLEKTLEALYVYEGKGF